MWGGGSGKNWGQGGVRVYFVKPMIRGVLTRWVSVVGGDKVGVRWGWRQGGCQLGGGGSEFEGVCGKSLLSGIFCEAI